MSDPASSDDDDKEEQAAMLDELVHYRKKNQKQREKLERLEEELQKLLDKNAGKPGNACKNLLLHGGCCPVLSHHIS